MRNFFVALDFRDCRTCLEFLKLVLPYHDHFKVGMELYYACGDYVIDYLKDKEAKVFLDLKLLDIPKTVEGAVRVLKEKHVDFLTIHASGGRKMLEQARKASGEDLKLFGITVLTSMDRNVLKEVGINLPLDSLVVKRAYLCKQAGLHGVVVPSSLVSKVKRTLGKDFLTIVPGIRPSWYASKDDHMNVSTPEEAIREGADYIVVGRAITTSEDPVKAIMKLKELL